MEENNRDPFETAALAASLLIALIVCVFTAGPAVEPALPESYIIDLNSAGEEQLTLLPGIGPGLARKIVSFRDREGPFGGMEDLMKIRGIGPHKARAAFRFGMLGKGKEAGKTR